MSSPISTAVMDLKFRLQALRHASSPSPSRCRSYSAKQPLRRAFSASPSRQYPGARTGTYPGAKRRLEPQFSNGEDSLQFFKEERLDGAVYNVYLKKVRYHTPDDQAEVDSSEDHKAHLQWRLEEIRVIKAGSLDRLVEALSSSTGEVDSTYVNVFLATYRGFASAKQVLNLLLARYRSISEDPKMKQHKKDAYQKTIKTVINVWMDTYPDDFREPPNFPCLRHIVTFCHKHMPKDNDIEKRARTKMEAFRAEDEPPTPVRVDEVRLELSLQCFQALETEQQTVSVLSRPVNFEMVPVDVFAQQLTYVDAELFKKVVPHHCLGSIWSRRDKKNDKAPSVNATISQFNAVAHVVIATALKYPDIPPADRSRVIIKWIDIAQECRVMKNFSSLKAILAGLQSNPVYRLHKVWDQIDREKMELFDELSDIFSEDHNQTMIRELLYREGTAKFADPESTNTIRGHRRQRSTGWTATWGKKKSASYFEVPQTVQGTVPYLGTFLTDLNMVDTANPDTTKDGLINFDKKRKEFEILAQIRLLQGAASMYQFNPDAAFFEWFHSLRIYDDSESHDLSCEIEPETPSTPEVPIKGHRKKSSLGFFSPLRRPSESVASSPCPSMTDLANSMDSLDVLDADAQSVYSNPERPSPISGPRPSFRHSVSSSMLGLDVTDLPVPAVSPWKSQESCVVKVILDVEDKKAATTFYKSIMLNNCDHTKTVISNILLKFDVSGQPDDYVIAQKLPEKELTIPDKGNVFYAINTMVPEILFVVRKKSELERLKAKHHKGRSKLKKISAT